MDGCETVAETVKMLKLGTSLSLSSGTFTIAPGHQMSGQQIMHVSPNNANNVNLVDLGKKLLDACKNGETEEVRNLMQSGAPFTTDWLGTSPLHFAAQYGHAETAELLLRAGVSRDTRTKVDRTPLHAAAQEGHLMIVSLLLLHGADVDAKDLLKMTPLHWAVERGHTDVVECLLTNGADVNLMSKFDKTPIDIALDTGRLDLVPLLQKYVNVSRPKPEVKQTAAPSSKLRPTVLPNKANRTSKTVKPSPTPVQQSSSVKQLFLPSSIGMQRTVSLDNVKKLLTSGNASGVNESSSNNVLAALAALAEATSGNSNANNSSLSNETLQWLEANASATTNDDTLFQSALESGQTVSLTEAGKLALSWVKEQNQSTTTSSSSGSSNKNSKVITIVADSTQLPQIISSTQATPIVLVSSSSLPDSNESHKKKHLKVTRPITLPTKTTNSVQNLSRQINLTTVKDSVQEEVAKLQKELEVMRKQAEDYKLQLREKEKEAESYKQQLDAIKADARFKTD